MSARSSKSIVLTLCGIALSWHGSAEMVLPGYLTDPTAMKEVIAKDAGYQPPERLKYPYVSTYYVKPTVTPEETVKVGIYVTDFDSSKIRFRDDSHRFSAFLEYRLKADRPECDPYRDGRAQTPAAPRRSEVLELTDLKSGDAEFTIGKLPVGEYEFRVWAVDEKGRESHRVIHDFRVMTAADQTIPADRVYAMTAADLAAYGIRNDGDLERIVYVATNGEETVVKEKRPDVPGYTVKVPLDPKSGKVPYRAFEKATVVYDAGYDAALAENNAVATSDGLQRLVNEKAAEGFRKLVLLPGVYRVSWSRRLRIPDRFTLDLGGATLKLNACSVASVVMVNLASTVDSHLVGGTLEGDYWAHDYKGAPSGSEWVSGFEIGGDSWYSSVEGVTVRDITGYGGQNGIAKDAKGDLAFFCDWFPAYAPGGLDPKTGIVDETDSFRFTTDFKDLKKIAGKGFRRLQVSKYLGYQGVATRSWQLTAAWYDAEKNFISAETCWQYREMWIPEQAAFIRISVEAESAEAAKKADLKLVAFRIPVNCAVKNCRFERCRCVGYAASAMKNMLFEGNFFTASGESAATCAFDAEDGWDQMQDVYYTGNVFRENPINNSILTCAGHNFIIERNDCDIGFWGRTHSPCVRDNVVGRGSYACDSRLRSGYGRFSGNTYSKALVLGENKRGVVDSWDYVLSDRDFDGEKDKFKLEIGRSGRLMNCNVRNMDIMIANAFHSTFENCKALFYMPSVRWLDVTVKDSQFKAFRGTNDWERCHFSNVKLNDFHAGVIRAKHCDFTGSTLFGLDAADLRMTDCRFDASVVQGNYWEKPAELVFKDCAITARDDAAFLKLGVYTVGRIGFDGCTVTGGQSLVNVFDLRPINYPKNADPAQNPDLRSGTIAFRGVAWQGAGKSVVEHPAKRGQISTKKLTILDKGNSWPAGVSVAADLPDTWELK